jgi:hypothetical protein
MKMAAPEGAAISWVQVLEERRTNRSLRVGLAASGSFKRGGSLFTCSVLASESPAYGRRAFALCRTNQRHACIITKHLNDFQQLIFSF